MKRSLMVAILAATTTLGGAALAQTLIADPAAEVTYEGTLRVMTKFGQQRLAPYFTELARAYEAAHPGVKIELIQEDDDSIKAKTKTLVASNAMPDVFFSWTGTWGGNFVRGARAVDLTAVIGPGTEWGAQMSPAAVDAFAYDGKNYGIPLYLDAKFMGYSKPAFAKAGVEVPSDLDGLLAACGLRQAARGGLYALGHRQQRALGRVAFHRPIVGL